MPPLQPHTLLKFLAALLKHQAKVWLGESAAGLLADALVDEELQARLDAWLQGEATQKRLLEAAQQARVWLQNPANCPDEDLRQLFHSLDFGTLPAVQQALRDLPQAMDAAALTAALQADFARTLPHLPAEKQAAGARLVTEALLRAVSTLRDFALPVVAQTTLTILAEQRAEFAAVQRKLDAILAALDAHPEAADLATLAEAVRAGLIIVHGDVQHSVLLIGAHNTVTLDARQAQALQPRLTLPGALPPGSRLPLPRNALFTGRESALQDLRSLQDFGGLGGTPAIAITGIGGVGKTQLAVEFAYRYGYRFRGVHWLDLRDPALFAEQVAACGQAMGLPRTPDEDLAAYVRRVLDAWKADGPRLLILDNLEDPAAARAILRRLQHPHLRLLVTARRTRWPADLGLRPLRLGVFTPDEARAFLRRVLPPARATDEDLDALAARLGYLPLALELAARYLAAITTLRVAAYLQRLEDAFAHPSMQGWRPEEGNPTDHDLSLQATFQLSWERLTDPAARRLFRACGYLAPNTPIPMSILRLVVPEDEALGQALDDLRNLGLLTLPVDRGGDGPTVHPLLAEFARRLPPPQAEDADADPATFLEALADLAVATNRQVDQSGDYSRFAPLLPHVRAAAEISEAHPSLQATAARLWNSLGVHLHDLADYAAARAAYERALGIFEKHLGEEHPHVATLVNNLGGVLRALGDLAGARAAFERALRIDEAVFGPNHPKVVIRVNNLGLVLQALGDLAGARAAYERALRIWEASLGPEHPQVATAVNNLAGVLYALSDFEGARAAFERALRIDEAVFGPDHPNVARDVNNLGGVLYALGDLAGARAAYERALRIWEASLGPEHPQVATAVNNLGLVLQDLGDFEGARAAYERALGIVEKHLGEEHPHVATTLNNLGLVLRALGDLAGARAAFERALRIDEAVFGPDHPKVATAVNNLGSVLQALGDLAGARAAFERALRIKEAIYEPDHPSIATTVNNLGGVLRALGDLAGARAAFERALGIWEASLGPEHPHTKLARMNLWAVEWMSRPGCLGWLLRFLAFLERRMSPQRRVQLAARMRQQLYHSPQGRASSEEKDTTR